MDNKQNSFLNNNVEFDFSLCHGNNDGFLDNNNYYGCCHQQYLYCRQR
jgi:hypothetical protein